MLVAHVVGAIMSRRRAIQPEHQLLWLSHDPTPQVQDQNLVPQPSWQWAVAWAAALGKRRPPDHLHRLMLGVA